LVGAVRRNHGRLPATSFLILDAQSVKNTSSAWHKGYDAGKKISGVKRHIAVDSQGLPHALLVTTANVSDKAGALQLLGKQQQKLRQVANVLVDGGYQGSRLLTTSKRSSTRQSKSLSGVNFIPSMLYQNAGW
jgi:hypothetical protein